MGLITYVVVVLAAGFTLTEGGYSRGPRPQPLPSPILTGIGHPYPSHYPAYVHRVPVAVHHVPAIVRHVPVPYPVHVNPVAPRPSRIVIVHRSGGGRRGGSSSSGKRHRRRRYRKRKYYKRRHGGGSS